MLQLTRQRHHTYKNNYHDKYFFSEILTIYIFHKKTRKAFKKPHSNNKKNKNRYFVSKHLIGKQTSKQTKNTKRETISQKQIQYFSLNSLWRELRKFH